MTFEEYKEQRKNPSFDISVNEIDYPNVLRMTEKIMVERNRKVDGAIFMEIQQIATEHGIETKYFLNEKAIVNALEKQIPKKIHKHHSMNKGFCPRCLSVEDNSANCCRVCGQLLDWSDTE